MSRELSAEMLAQYVRLVARRAHQVAKGVGEPDESLRLQADYLANSVSEVDYPELARWSRNLARRVAEASLNAPDRFRLEPGIPEIDQDPVAAAACREPADSAFA